VGLWGGRASSLLGLRGEVDKRSFEALCDNLHPTKYGRLTQRTNSERRIGYDFNFHVPKSVSVIYARTQDARILEAFRTSVADTMREMESDVKTRVRKGGRDETRGTGNWTYAEFVHFTARPVDGVPDPHLHAHCFVFNATWDPEEKAWKAIDVGTIKRDARYYEAAFHTQLASEMIRLGYPIERTATGWEIASIPASVIRKNSRRTGEIEKLAEELGIVSDRVKDKLGATTRSRKRKDLTMPELQELWESRYTEDERKSLERAAAGLGPPSPVASPDEAVDYAIRHCFERDAVVPEKRLVEAAIRYGVGSVNAQQARARLADHGVITASLDGQLQASTLGVLEEERRMAAFAREGRGACLPLGRNGRKFTRDWLNQDQKAAVRHILESPDRVIAVRGRAGVGKTSSMTEAREAIEETGRRIFAFANSADASRDVLRNEGFEDADTIARLLVDEKLQNRLKGQVILIDEVGLVGTRSLARVFEVAERQNARVILVGDNKQHGSVERGAVMRVLEEQAGVRPAEIREIQRQSGNYKEAVKALADGRVGEAFQRFDDLGWIHELPDEERQKTLATEYADAVLAGERVLVVSPTHREGDRVTAAIREELKTRGMIGKDERRLLSLEPLHLTEAERGDAVNYSPGDVIVFHQNAKNGFKKGDRIMVGTDTGALPLAQADRFQVYRAREMDLAPGDRVRITANGFTLDRQHRFNNGAVYGVRGFTPEGNLILDNGWVVSKDYGFLSHGVVLTSHASQGKTVPGRVIIAQSGDSRPASTTQQFYVSSSRSRSRVSVYTDDKETLLEAISRTERKRAAHDLAVMPARPVGRERGRLLDIARRAQRVAVLQEASRSGNEPRRDREQTVERRLGHG
jgi:conjugative relaxase-like TrwC/TraI family protein